MLDDPISRIEAALENPALYDEGASIADTKMAVTVLTLACSPTAIRALLDRLKAAEDNVRKANAQAEHFGREWFLPGERIEELEVENEHLRETLQELIESRDAYNSSETTPQLRDNVTRLRRAEAAARAALEDANGK